MPHIPSSPSTTARAPYIFEDHTSARTHAGRTSEASGASSPQEPDFDAAPSSRQHDATPAELHPWAGTFVRMGHTLTQYSARVQVFFEGLVGLSSPNLQADHHDQAVAAMAQRLFEIRRLSGEAPRSAQMPMAQDIAEAAHFLAQQRTFRGYGDQINRGIYGVAHWCKAWFV